MSKVVHLEDWVRDLLVDPLSKEPLCLGPEGNCMQSPYGRTYPVVDGIANLRCLTTATTADQRLWLRGQEAYEKWDKKQSNADVSVFEAEKDSVREVYEDISLEGACLDVGGHQGRLRAFLTQGQRYVGCDPYLYVFRNLEKHTELVRAYPFLLDKVNFVCCDAEFLPFRSSSFQTVHMRSVIDHFLNPEMALREAYRVLGEDGCLIIGLFIRGGKSGKVSFSSHIKELCRHCIPSALGDFKDHHIWHPSFKELSALVEVCGFQIKHVHWQRGTGDSVVYLKARKVIDM